MMNKTEIHVSRSYRRSGLTLIELLVVIAIVGILSAFVANNVIHNISKAKVAAAKAQIKVLHNAIKQYWLDTGEYPSSSDGLEALVVEPAGITGWNRDGYLDSTEVPLDPWGREYYYDYPGEYGVYDIYTLGKDGQDGGEDEDTDIYNSNLAGGSSKEDETVK